MGRFGTCLTREVAPETLVSKVPWQRTAGVTEKDRFQEGLTRDPATEAPVAGVVVAESCFEGGLTRGDASQIPVTGVLVAEGR